MDVKNKTPIVMLHGFCGDPEIFYHQKKFFSEKTIPTYTPNWFSRFKNNLNSKAPLIPQVVHTLHDDLDESHINKPLLVGHSMGGVIALVAAHQYPESFSGIIFLDSSLTPTPEKKTLYEKLYNDFLNCSDKSIFIERLFDKVLFLPSDDLKVKADIIDQAKRQTDPLWFRILAQAVNTDFKNLLEILNIPALFIGSQEPFSDTAKIKALNPKIKIKTIDHSGHFMMCLAPQAVNKNIKDFYEEISHPA